MTFEVKAFELKAGAITALMLSPSIGRGLTHFANEIVIPFAQAYVGQEWDGKRGNLPPRPAWRTGKLQGDMHPEPPQVEGDSLVVYGVTDPINPLDGHHYAPTLLRGEGNLKDKYRFLPDDWFR